MLTAWQDELGTWSGNVIALPRLMRNAFIAALLIVAFAAAASAQERSADVLAPLDSKLILPVQGDLLTPPASETRLADRAVRADGRDTATARQRSNDSVLNGAIIGAIAGGLALGGFAGIICHALHEEGNPSCWPGTLAIAGIGAAGGAAIGAGIDALASRTGPRLAVRVSF